MVQPPGGSISKDYGAEAEKLAGWRHTGGCATGAGAGPGTGRAGKPCKVQLLLHPDLPAARCEGAERFMRRHAAARCCRP